MIVCGEDALAERLAAELTTVYGERVTLVAPPEQRNGSPPPRGHAPGWGVANGRLQVGIAPCWTRGG